MKRITFKKLLPWIGVFAVMGVIFYFSSQPAPVSNANSVNLLFISLKIFRSVFNIPLTDQSIIMLVGRINDMAREYMHSFVFFLAGLCIYYAVSRFQKKRIHTVLRSAVFCMIYAILDEIHQLFVPGRAFELVDLALDFTGSSIGILLMYFIQGLRRKRLKLKNHDHSTTF